MNMVIKYIWMYLLMGLVCNTLWAVSFSIYMTSRTWKWISRDDYDEIMDELMDTFIGQYGASRLIHSLFHNKKNMPKLAESLIAGYTMWPWNIAYGATRVPFVLERLKQLEKELA